MSGGIEADEARFEIGGRHPGIALERTGENIGEFTRRVLAMDASAVQGATARAGRGPHANVVQLQGDFSQLGADTLK